MILINSVSIKHLIQFIPDFIFIATHISHIVCENGDRIKWLEMRIMLSVRSRMCALRLAFSLLPLVLLLMYEYIRLR